MALGRAVLRLSCYLVYGRLPVGTRVFVLGLVGRIWSPVIVQCGVHGMRLSSVRFCQGCRRYVQVKLESTKLQ